MLFTYRHVQTSCLIWSVITLSFFFFKMPSVITDQIMHDVKYQKLLVNVNPVIILLLLKTVQQISEALGLKVLNGTNMQNTCAWT